MGANHELSLIVGEAFGGPPQKSQSGRFRLATPPRWAHAGLQASASEGVAQYRDAAKVASAAEARWRRQLMAGNDVKSLTLFDEYQIARFDCHAKRVVLNYLLDQLGYVATGPTQDAYRRHGSK